MDPRRVAENQDSMNHWAGIKVEEAVGGEESGYSEDCKGG